MKVKSSKNEVNEDEITQGMIPTDLPLECNEVPEVFLPSETSQQLRRDGYQTASPGEMNVESKASE